MSYAGVNFKMDRNRALITAALLRFDVKKLTLTDGHFAAIFYDGREPLEGEVDWDVFTPETTLREVLDALLGEETFRGSGRMAQLLAQREKIQSYRLEDLK